MGRSIRLVGVGASSEGTVVGPAFVHIAGSIKPERENILEDEMETELVRFREAIEGVVRKLSETRGLVKESSGEEEAAIFDAQTPILR